MRNFFALGLIFLLHSLAIAGNVKITGKISNPKTDKVYLITYINNINFETRIIDSSAIDKSGNFNLNFTWNQSFPAQFVHGEKPVKLFLSPGDNLQITADANAFESSILFRGKGADVNNYLISKAGSTPPFYTASYKLPLNEFTQLVDSLYRNELNNYQQWLKTANKNDASVKAFIPHEESEITYSLASKKITYPGSHAYYNKLQTPPEVPADYYNFTKSLSVDNDAALTSYSYLSYLENYSYFLATEESKSTAGQLSVEQIFDVVERFFKGESKEYLYAKWIQSLIVNHKEFVTASEFFSKYKTFAKNKMNILALENELAMSGALLPGTLAPDFLAIDLDGNARKLSDYKGKVVYLDVWASWCGPCLREIPHAEKLQQELKGKDIVFLCVSVDDNENAWRNIIKARNIGGVHLLSDKSKANNVSALYSVNGIPRYIIVDKDGKLVDPNAKRPSFGVKEDLEKLLNN